MQIDPKLRILALSERKVLIAHILNAVGTSMDPKTKDFLKQIQDKSVDKLLIEDEDGRLTPQIEEALKSVGAPSVAIDAPISSFDPRTGETVRYLNIEQACLLLGTRRDRIENAIANKGKHLKLRWQLSS